MKIFYSAEDIETLASQGVRELVVDENTVLTSVARETAEQLGVNLVTAGQGKAGGSASAAPAVSPRKPRGCQHGPLGGDQGQATAPGRAPGGSSPVVDELIGAVKQLVKHG